MSLLRYEIVSMMQAQASGSQLDNLVLSPTVDYAALDQLLVTDPLSVNRLNEQSGQTPLHVAARRGNLELLRKLTGVQGVDLEVRTHTGDTALLVACQGGSLYAVAMLVECGADPGAVDLEGRGALHYCAQIGAVHIIHYLVTTQNLSFDTANNEGYNPLHMAVMNSNIATVEYFLKNKRIDPSLTTKRGSTPLHMAASLGSRKMCWILVCSSRKNLLEMKDANGCTALDHALRGVSERHKVLATRLQRWSSLYFRSLSPRFTWLFFFLLPGASLLLAMLLFCHVFQPVGFILAIFVVIAGFFVPMSPHRIRHECGWPSPALFGAFLSGITLTAICYFVDIVPRIWPGNILWFCLAMTSSFFVLYFLFKIKTTGSGEEKIGKRDSSGKPLTILDVARQYRNSPSHADNQEHFFCTTCEIVTPDRAKHCKLCQKCFNGFDHHCMWLMKCIASRNHRMFILLTFCVGLDNFLFVRAAFACLAFLHDTYNPFTLILEAFDSEHWMLFMVVCNFLTGIFALMNFVQQLMLISTRETTYFDASGRMAYSKKRERSLTFLTRMKIVYMFFSNYNKWFHLNDPSNFQGVAISK